MKLESFMRNNKDLTIQRTDKGKKTIIMKKEVLNRLKYTFMQKAQNKGLYRFVKTINNAKNEINTVKNHEIAKLRKKMSLWKKNGIYKITTEQNTGKEKKLWGKATKVGGSIPEIVFVRHTKKTKLVSATSTLKTKPSASKLAKFFSH